MGGDRVPAGALPIRRVEGAIVVELPRRARRFLVHAAETVQRCVEDPSSPGFGRLYGLLDENAEMDDPLVRLERQTVIDDICAVVIDTARNDRLTETQGEAWLRMLGMAVMVIAADAGIRTEEDLERLDRSRSQVLDLVRSLQLLVARSLDPTLDDLEELDDSGDPETD